MPVMCDDGHTYRIKVGSQGLQPSPWQSSCWRRMKVCNSRLLRCETADAWRIRTTAATTRATSTRSSRESHGRTMIHSMRAPRIVRLIRLSAFADDIYRGYRAAPTPRVPRRSHITLDRGSGTMGDMAPLIAVVAFFVVLVGSVTLGRWLQRKGSDLEKGPKDDVPR
jgi:hypothetical protein